VRRASGSGRLRPGVAIARERLARFPNVRVERRTLHEETPEGPFDLIVVSEVLYYLPREQMLAAQGRLERSWLRVAYCSPSTGVKRPGPNRSAG